jgi:hypothetical protein
MEVVRSGNLGMNLDRARPGMKRGPYVRKRRKQQARIAELRLESTAEPGRKYYGLDDSWIGNVC